MSPLLPEAPLRAQADPDLVLAVDREEMVDQRAAARTERETVQTVALGQLGRHAVDIGGYGDTGIAGDGEPADPVRGGEIALEQERREAENIADVVEAVTGRIGWQQRRHVDVEGKQIAHRVAVLGAVQPVQDGRAARIRVGIRGGVEPALDPGRDAIVRGRGRPRPTGWWHRAVPEPPDDVLPALRVTGDLADVERVESEPRLAPDGRALVVARLAVTAQDRLSLRAGAGLIGSDRSVPRLREAGRRRPWPHECGQ